MQSPPQSAYAQAALDLLQDTAQPGRLRLRVISNSMRPWFQAGDNLLIERAPVPNLRSGDMIVWRSAQTLITHRVVAVQAEHLVTKGDATWRFDPPVPTEAVLGRVLALELEKGSLSFNSLLWQATCQWQARLSRWEGRLERVWRPVAFPVQPWLRFGIKLLIWPWRWLMRGWIGFLKWKTQGVAEWI